jgi:tetratricopeptide (TPR) repeat protein
VRLLREHSSSELAFTVVILGLVLSRGEEVDRARQTLEEGLAIATTAADRRAAIWALHSRGELERDQGNVSLAQWLLESALAEAAAAGQPLATILQGLGDLALDRGRTEEAMDCYVKALREATKTRHPVATYCAAGMAAILATEGRITDAGTLWGASQRMAEQIGITFGGGAFALEVHRYEALLPAPDDKEFARAVAEGRADDPLRVMDAMLATLG